MIPVHLDTGFLIRALVPGSREDQALRNWLQHATQVAMSVVGWAEFLCGPLSDAEKVAARQFVGAPVPLEEKAAELAAVMFNGSGRRRGSFLDCLIAATAVNAGAHLATNNPADFRRFADTGLELA